MSSFNFQNEDRDDDGYDGGGGDEMMSPAATIY